MVERRTYLRYAFAAVLLAPFACGDSNDHPGDSRVLDVACAKTTSISKLDEAPAMGCGLLGSAKKVSGLTADSTGLRIGPAAGTVTIAVPPLNLPGADDTWTYEILARGVGYFDVPSCTESSTTEPGAETSDTGNCIARGAPTGTFDWIPVGAEGRLGPATAGRKTMQSTISLHVAEGSTLEIVDVRIVSSESPKGCN